MEVKIPLVKESSQLDTLGANISVGVCNWPAEFPYSPSVSAKIAHTGKSILLRYNVMEDYTMAVVQNDNGEVWTDSCVEFFINFDNSGYYNFEFTCIGRMLLGFRKERAVFTHADNTVLSTIERHSSLGNQCFSEIKKEGQSWTIDIEIPTTALFKHNIESLCGMTARGNFYKCGDSLSVPHFLSWAPIDTPSPDFHCEEFFGSITFE